MKEIKLENKYTDTKYSSMDEFFCEITDELDKLAGLTVDEEHIWRHYILADNYCIKEKCLAIRIPGGTVGGIWINEDNVVTKIMVDRDYVVKTYSKDVNDKIQKFVGEAIEF